MDAASRRELAGKLAAIKQAAGRFVNRAKVNIGGNWLPWSDVYDDLLTYGEPLPVHKLDDCATVAGVTAAHCWAACCATPRLTPPPDDADQGEGR